VNFMWALTLCIDVGDCIRQTKNKQWLSCRQKEDEGKIKRTKVKLCKMNKRPFIQIARYCNNIVWYTGNLPERKF
jgi:hypothetical protein